MTSSNLNIFRATGPLWWGIHRSPVNSPHKGQWRGALMFSMICAWTNGWANHRDVGDLRRHHAHYDVIVRQMLYFLFTPLYIRLNAIPTCHRESRRRWANFDVSNGLSIASSAPSHHLNQCSPGSLNHKYVLWPLLLTWINFNPVNSPHKWPITRKMLPLMTSSWKDAPGIARNQNILLNLELINSSTPSAA